MYKSFFKRIFDFLFASILLILVSLPMLLIAVAIKIERNGPVIFSQVRFGVDSKPFKIFKFRTMMQNTPEIANQEFEDMQNFVTPIGYILRKTSLDELPQLVNVLRGEMSFIGPRPLAATDMEVIDLRKSSGADGVRPGITGLAQVNGRNLVSNVDKAAFDHIYADNVSLRYDMHIVWLTLVSVLKQTGIDSNEELK